MTEPNIYVIEPQTGYWLATVPAVMGCNASGKTRDEAIANVRKTFTAYLALLTARGVSIEHWKGLDPDRFPVATNPPASPLFPEDEIQDDFEPDGVLGTPGLADEAREPWPPRFGRATTSAGSRRPGSACC